MQELHGKIFSQITLPKLISLTEASQETMVASGRLLELCESGFAPHLTIDKGPPLFFKKDILRWVKENLIHIEGGKALGEIIAVAPEAHPKTSSLPKALRTMEHQLYEWTHIEGVSCVYFLCNKGEVVYIGKTTSLGIRLASHIFNKEFTKTFYIKVPKSELSKTELAFIRILRPKYNEVSKNCAIRLEDKEVMQEYAN